MAPVHIAAPEALRRPRLRLEREGHSNHRRGRSPRPPSGPPPRSRALPPGPTTTAPIRQYRRDRRTERPRVRTEQVLLALAPERRGSHALADAALRPAEVRHQDEAHDRQADAQPARDGAVARRQRVQGLVAERRRSRISETSRDSSGTSQRPCRDFGGVGRPRTSPFGPFQRAWGHRKYAQESERARGCAEARRSSTPLRQHSHHGRTANDQVFRPTGLPARSFAPLVTVAV